jgi:carboxyl-terminal processing protease
LEDHYAYIRISQFQSHTNEDMLKAIKKLNDKADDDLRGLILDLRNNPGGVLNAAVSVSDAFLASGRIVYTEGREEESELSFDAAPDDVMAGAPVVVLVNEGSASASEIVAGALQDNSRAVIMGKQTFGKGSVQTIIPVNKRSALKLTTARYFTPSGRSIQAEGIKPDIKLEDVEVSRAQAKHVKPLKEANLSGHLQNGNTNGKRGDAAAKPGEDKDSSPLAAKDYQLGEALNLLKGLAILHRRQER